MFYYCSAIQKCVAVVAIGVMMAGVYPTIENVMATKIASMGRMSRSVQSGRTSYELVMTFGTMGRKLTEHMN